MRILHSTDSYLPHIGGGETLIRNLCLEQRARGHVVAITAASLPGYPQEELIDDIPVFRRRAADEKILTDPHLLRHFVEDARKIKQRWQPDIVHVHGTALSSWINYLSTTADARSCANIVTLHGLLRLPESVQRRILEQADIVTAVSESLKSEFTDLVSARGDAIRVIYNGIAAPKIAPTAICFEPAKALCYGRLVDDKGFDVALHALAEVPEVQVVLAGDGIARPDLERLALRLGVSDRVTFLGFVHPDSIHALINEVSFVVVPSRFKDPAPLVTVEAALMGRPVVASKRGGIPEIIYDGETGHLVPAEDPAALAAAMRALIADPAQAERMGSLARARALARFSIARCADEFEAVYKNAFVSPR
jgi:glycosyltransferase involved in cell wall biosynthesis